jgi:hypothetical protein
MRTPLDSLRSVNRYIALALGPQWEVRLSSEKGTFNRPYARVIQVPSIELVIESWIASRMQAVYQIVCFPEVGQNADESQANMLEAVDLLWQAFGGQGVEGGRIARVPLYDYYGIPLTGPEAFAVADDRKTYDFLKVEGAPSFVPTQDPDDELLWSVGCNITMSWLRSAVVPSTGNTAESVTATSDGST